MVTRQLNVPVNNLPAIRDWNSGLEFGRFPRTSIYAPTRKISRFARLGFTLTESAIVLGVMGLILRAIWVAAAQAYNTHKVTKAAKEAMDVLLNYRQIWSKRGIAGAAGGAWTDVTCIGVNGGFFPPDMITGTCPANYPQSAWSQSVFVQV